MKSGELFLIFHFGLFAMLLNPMRVMHCSMSKKWAENWKNNVQKYEKVALNEKTGIIHSI